MSVTADRYKIEFSTCGLDICRGYEFVSSPRCGAVNAFLGCTRDTDSMTKLEPLEPIEAIYYEAHESLAIKQVTGIIEYVLNSGDTNSRAYVALRLGRVPVQEVSIIICVSSTGRDFSHQATMTILRQLKATLAVWKKIEFASGSHVWAGADKSEASWLVGTDNDKNMPR